MFKTGIIALVATTVVAFPYFPIRSNLVAEESRFDVNDVSYLWPVPKTRDDVDVLLSADILLEDSSTPIWPKDLFDAVIEKAQSVVVKNSAGRENQIQFAEFKDAFSTLSSWKVVAFRVDPSAPGSAPKITEAFGSVPQIRLIVQPVTVNESGTVRVHDVTAHLVFNFVKRFEPPVSGIGPPKAIPDKEQFAAIVEDLKGLKSCLKEAGVVTDGVLSVHPGLKASVPGFADKVKSFLRKRVTKERLSAVAFMGLEPPEPWIFFAMTKKDGKLIPAPQETLGNEFAQMLTFRGGVHVMPKPATTNMDGTKGVSTSVMFANDIASKLDDPVFDGDARPQKKDIPDIIANPERAGFFNTDCVSCHSESSRRVALGIGVDDDKFRFVRRDGISGVDKELLPRNEWNVRNFGWFPLGGTVPTITMRTANEAAESADYINRVYLGQK